MCILHNIKLQQSQDMVDVNDRKKCQFQLKQTILLFLTARAINQYLQAGSKHNIDLNSIINLKSNLTLSNWFFSPKMALSILGKKVMKDHHYKKNVALQCARAKPSPIPSWLLIGQWL